MHEPLQNCTQTTTESKSRSSTTKLKIDTQLRTSSRVPGDDLSSTFGIKLTCHPSNAERDAEYMHGLDLFQV